MTPTFNGTFDRTNEAGDRRADQGHPVADVLTTADRLDDRFVRKRPLRVDLPRDVRSGRGKALTDTAIR